MSYVDRDNGYAWAHKWDLLRQCASCGDDLRADEGAFCRECYEEPQPRLGVIIADLEREEEDCS